MYEKNKSVISLNELAKKNRNREPRFIEEIRRDENWEIIAYVLKRNPNYKKLLNGVCGLKIMQD